MSYEHDEYEEHRARRAAGRTVADWLAALVRAGVVDEMSVTLRMDQADHQLVDLLARFVSGPHSRGVRRRLAEANQPFADGEPAAVADVIEARIGHETGQPYSEHVRGVLVGCRQRWSRHGAELRG